MTVFCISIVQFSEECDIQCSRYREQSGISWRAFARPESPFHMFYPAAITMNGMEFTSAGQYMLCKHAGKWNIYTDGYEKDIVAFHALILLVGWQKEHPACKKWVVRYWHGYVYGARCKSFAYYSADVTETSSCLLSLKSRMIWRFCCWLM